jgi:type I restriction enzyme, S subunit
MSEWQRCKLCEQINLKRGYDLPIHLRVDGCIPIYSSSGVTGFHSEKKCIGPGVIAGRYGTIGQIFFSRGEYWPLNTTLYVQDFKGNDEHFIYYFLQQLDWEKYNDKSAVPGVNRNDVHQEEIYLPPLAEQKAIAQVLSSLDDKIDLLHRQNKTLEAIAETLFRQWFIEEMKNDWREGTLADISDNIRDAVKPADIQESTIYVGLEHIDRRDITLKQSGSGEDVNSNKYAFRSQDILFGKLRPYFHKVCFTPFSGICSTDILVIRPKQAEWFPFCLFSFFQDDVVEFANLGSGGTRMPRTSWQNLKSYPINIPDTEKLIRFNQLVLPSIEKITDNLKRVQTLEQLRDTLLPKLMSGEVLVEQ